MSKEKNKNCNCPNKSCARNGYCDECIAYHNGNTYCKKNPPKGK